MDGESMRLEGSPELCPAMTIRRLTRPYRVLTEGGGLFSPDKRREKDFSPAFRLDRTAMALGIPKKPPA